MRSRRDGQSRNTANDITLAELALETFFPSAAFSAQYLRELAELTQLSDEITL